MKMMIFVVKVRMFLHNLAFLEIACYVLFLLVAVISLRMERNIELLCESLDKEVHEVRGKCQISTSGKKTARKGGQSKLRNKNNARRLYPKRSFKETAIFRCFAICATNSLLLCVGKRDLNKMCKSRSLTKVRNILQHSAGGLSDCDALFY